MAPVGAIAPETSLLIYGLIGALGICAIAVHVLEKLLDAGCPDCPHCTHRKDQAKAEQERLRAAFEETLRAYEKRDLRDEGPPPDQEDRP